MVGNPFGFGSTFNPTQHMPWGGVTSHMIGAYPAQAYPQLSPGGFAFSPYQTPIQSAQTPIQSAQQIVQWLQLLPHQLQQLTYLQQQALQQLLQVLPAQYQQVQLLIQVVPQLIHQLQQQLLAQPGAALSQAGFPGIGAAQPFPAFPTLSTVFAAQPSQVM